MKAVEESVDAAAAKDRCRQIRGSARDYDRAERSFSDEFHRFGMPVQPSIDLYKHLIQRSDRLVEKSRDNGVRGQGPDSRLLSGRRAALWGQSDRGEVASAIDAIIVEGVETDRKDHGRRVLAPQEGREPGTTSCIDLEFTIVSGELDLYLRYWPDKRFYAIKFNAAAGFELGEASPHDDSRQGQHDHPRAARSNHEVRYHCHRDQQDRRHRLRPERRLQGHDLQAQRQSAPLIDEGICTCPRSPRARNQLSPRPRPQDDTAKKWAIIGGITVVVLVGGFFVLKTLMEEDRGGRSLVTRSRRLEAGQEDGRRRHAGRAAAAAHPPVRGVRPRDPDNDKKLIARYSELDESKLELLMTEERIKILTDSLTSRRWKYNEKPEKFDTGTTRISATYMNSRGFELMELALTMRQRGGPEDWLVTKVEDRWFASSGKTPESRVVELGANRAVAAAPLKDPATFNKMPESEPKQLDWIPGTTQEQKNEIERHIKDLFDEKHPAKLSKASTALATIGKPAIPRLLNQFIGLDLRKDDDIKRGNSVDRTLAALTDVEMGFDPAQLPVRRERFLRPRAGCAPSAAGSAGGTATRTCRSRGGTRRRRNKASRSAVAAQRRGERQANVNKGQKS